MTKEKKIWSGAPPKIAFFNYIDDNLLLNRSMVALIRGKKLYVANAGDSRCIVCREGKAIEMSAGKTHRAHVIVLGFSCYVKSW